MIRKGFLSFCLPSLTLILAGVLSVAAQNKNLRPVENLTIENANIGLRSFAVNAKKNDVIALEIKQNGADVKVKLFDPQGAAAAESDYPFSEQEVERIYVIANQDGVFRLEITSKFPDEKGSINIKLNELKTAAPDDFKRAEAERMFSQAQTVRITGKTADRKKAIEIYQQSLVIWQEMGDENGKMRTLSILSYLNRILGNYDKSAEFAELILSLPDSAQNNSYKSDALYQIGQIQYFNGEISESIATLQKSMAIFSEPSPKQLNILATLGFSYQSIDEFESAQKAFDEAMRNIRQFPDVYNEAQVLHLYGFFNFNSNEFELAVENFKRAATLREKFGNRRGQAISLTFLGMSYQSLGMLDEAFTVLQKALPISREFGDTINQLDTLQYLARVMRDKGNLLDAIELYKQGLSLFEDQNSTHLATTYLSLGVSNIQLSNFTEAHNYFDKALLLFRRAGNIGGETLTLYQKANLESVENRLDEAKAKIERALEIHEYEQAKYKNIRRLSGFLEQRRRYFDLYIDILIRLDKERPGENFALKALQVSESARMRTLIWQYREAIKNNPQTVDFQLISRIQKIQQQIGEQLSLLAKAQSNADQSNTISDIEKTIADLNKQDESLKAQLRASNPNIANLAQPPTLSLAQMQAELDADTVLVEYSLGEQRSYLWIVGKDGFQSFVLPKRAEIEAQARIFYETLNQTPEVSDNRRADKKVKTKPVAEKDSAAESEKLSRMLLIENLAKLPAKRLVFVADGALNLIPPASLTFFDAANKKQSFLAEKFDTVQLPSLTTLHVLREKGIKTFAPQNLAIIADPVFSPTDNRLAKNIRQKSKPNSLSADLSATLRDFSLTSLSRLPFTRIEAEKIAENAPAGTNLNLDFKASRERLLNGEFDRFDILHFATHGFLNNRHPELSGLVLSLVDEKGNQQNGFLRTQDLYLLGIKPQMVVLSACQTGLGKQVENEGLIGLTRGFLANGTPRVIASFWKVDDTATAELMSRFYRAMLKENQSPSTALRTAQNELRQILRFSNPRFWAGFTLTGEWR